MSRELEARLLASIPSVGHFQHLEELGIDESSFQFYGAMYRYIHELVRDHNHLPRLLDLKATFNVPEHVRRKPEEYDWLLEDFLRLTTVQKIQNTFDSNIDQYGDDPRQLIPSLIRSLTEIAIPDDRTYSLTDHTAEKRIETYKDLMINTNGMMAGIPTGISYFDSQWRLGWMPGELIAIIGRLFVGKSWMLMYHGIISWLAGKRVLFLSPEMPTDEAEARFDALVCGIHNVAVNLDDLYRGFKPTKQQADLMAQIGNRSNWITMPSVGGKPFTLGEIPRLIQQFVPDVVLIDGMLLIKADKRVAAGWEQVYEISYGLKNIAMGTNTVIIAAHQANRNAYNTARPPGLHEIYMGDSLAQACDRVMSLSKPHEPKNTLRLTIQKFRKGKEYYSGIDFDFNPGVGRIRELDDQHPRTASSDGDLGTDLQAGAGDEDLVPLPIP